MRQDDQNWVQRRIDVAAEALRQEIRTATQRPELVRLKKFLRWMREWSLIGAVIGAAVALVVLSVNNAVKDSYFRGQTETRLTQTEARLTRIEADVLALRPKLDAANPTDKANQDDAVAALEDARKRSISLPVTDVELAGTRFTAAAADDPKAWNVALRFLDYRSLLNAALSPKSNDFGNVPINWKIEFFFGPIETKRCERSHAGKRGEGAGRPGSRD